jgi:1-deoxy-D-xylulose-5-phosphate reductoisomerase
MRLPISLALGWPDRVPDATPAYDWSAPHQWTFEPLDEEAFPAVRLARDAVLASPLHPAVFTAANEECVEAFLAGRLPFLGIVDTVARVLDEFEAPHGVSLEAVMGAEEWAREAARAHV